MEGILSGRTVGLRIRFREGRRGFVGRCKAGPRYRFIPGLNLGRYLAFGVLDCVDSRGNFGVRK